MHFLFIGCGIYNVGTRIELAEKFTELSVLGLVGVGRQFNCFPLRRNTRRGIKVHLKVVQVSISYKAFLLLFSLHNQRTRGLRLQESISGFSRRKVVNLMTAQILRNLEMASGEPTILEKL